MNRSAQKLIVRLWKDWCRVWPEQYGHESLDVSVDGYDPVFDLIPTQAYRDFYLEVARHHPALRHLNPFEVIDVALNQVQAPETTRIVAEETGPRPEGAHDRVEPHEELPEPTVVEVELVPAEVDRRRADSA